MKHTVFALKLEVPNRKPVCVIYVSSAFFLDGDVYYPMTFVVGITPEETVYVDVDVSDYHRIIREFSEGLSGRLIEVGPLGFNWKILKRWKFDAVSWIPQEFRAQLKGARRQEV